MKVTVIFHCLGPYHVARLAAAGKLVDLTAIELASESQEYAWDKVKSGDSFRRVTLFPTGDSRSVDNTEVRRRLHSTLGAAQPEIVVVPGWSDVGALAGLAWSGRSGVPAVVMSESTAWDERRVGWKEWIKRQLVRLCSAGLVGGTPHAEYLTQLGLPREQIFLGYDAVDNDYFDGQAAEVRQHEAEIRLKHMLPRRYFLASARFVEKKNLPRLLKAFARYRQMTSATESDSPKREAWDLVLLGDGPLHSSILNLRSALGLDSFVHLPGFKQYPDLPAYYGCASAFIHASTTEQWGLVVNEAMASSLPVLVSNSCGCAADLVQDGVNGFAFDPNNIDEIANAMLRVWKMKDEALKQMSFESTRIISSWGPRRFASGLKAAAEKALAVGPVKPTLLQRLLLKALLAR